MADDVETTGQADDENKINNGPRDDAVLQLMEDVLEKLKILNYEKELSNKKKFNPLNKTYFVFPENIMTSSSLNASSAAGNQLKKFLDIMIWLMKICQQDFTIDKYDDPNTSVNKLLLILKNMGFPLDFPVTKLKQGYGEATCMCLNFICDKSLNMKSFVWKKPYYPKEDFAEEAAVDDKAEVDTINDQIDDNTIKENEEIDDEMYHNNHVSTTISKKSNTNEGTEDLTNEIITSAVDPIAWKTELERVGPKLKSKVKDIITTKEWRTHIQQMKTHETIIQQMIGATGLKLKQISSQLVDILEKMTTKEKYINNQFDHLRQEYYDLKVKLEGMNDKYKEITEKVNQYSTEYSILSDQLNEIKTNMDDKGIKMTDTSPLVKIKGALQSIKQEIKTYELRIGVVGHTLLQIKSKQKEKRRQMNKSKLKDPEYNNEEDEDEYY